MTHLVDTLPDRTLLLNGKEYLYFSGTSYLGISRNEEFQHYLQEGFARYGTNYSSSRISNIRLSVFEEAENQLATNAGAEAALTFSSGFLAGQALVRLLQTEGQFLYAPRTHPALALKYPLHSSEKYYAEWVQNLPMHVSQLPDSRIILLVNSLDPLYAEKHDFSWVADLPQNRQFTLVMDDSHGLGVIGADGSGIFGKVQPPSHVELLVVGSLGKALGLPGGVVLGSTQRINQLKKSPFFTAGSPMPPAYLYAFLQSQSLYDLLRQRLSQNTILFQQKTAASNHFYFFDNYPVFYTPHNELYQHLYNRHILISSFAYPSPHDSPITRVIINALHTIDDIEQLSIRIAEF